MYTQKEKSKENRGRAINNSVNQSKSHLRQGSSFADNHPEAIAQRRLQATIDSIPQSIQMKAFRGALNSNAKHEQATKSQAWAKEDAVQRHPQSETSIQRYPITLNELNDNNKNPKVFTDSRYNWMRMIESNLGLTTFELLKPNGAPSGSLMIWEEDYDQYRFSPDGRGFDDAMFPPHFMEEITGDARIADRYDSDLEQMGIGEYGVGFRPANGRTATLETFGLVSCVGFALVGESAGFLCHMLVGERQPNDEGTLKAQVNALVNRFTTQSGERDIYCQLVFDFFTYQREPSWLNWMKPDGIHTETKDDTKHRLVIKGHEDGPSLMWRGSPIRY